MARGTAWTEMEDQILIDKYGEITVAEIHHTLIPNRTPEAIKSRAKLLQKKKKKREEAALTQTTPDITLQEKPKAATYPVREKVIVAAPAPAHNHNGDRKGQILQELEIMALDSWIKQIINNTKKDDDNDRDERISLLMEQTERISGKIESACEAVSQVKAEVDRICDAVGQLRNEVTRIHSVVDKMFLLVSKALEI